MDDDKLVEEDWERFAGDDTPPDEELYRWDPDPEKIGEDGEGSWRRVSDGAPHPTDNPEPWERDGNENKPAGDGK